MMFQLCLLLFLVLVTCSLAILLDRSFDETIPLPFFGIVFILFVFGFLKILEAGVYMILGTGIALPIAAFFSFRRNKKTEIRSGLIKKLLTPGTFLFVLLFIVLSFLNRDRVMYGWDELSHWGSVVKVMLHYNDFGTVPEAECLYAAYPPGMALFQYFVLKLNSFFEGTLFSEWRLYFSYQIFGYAVLLPFLRGLSFRKPAGVVVRLAIIILIPQFFLNNYFQGIYIDSFLGVLFGAMLAYAWFTEYHGLCEDLVLMLGCGMLVLTKTVGAFFGIMVAVVYSIRNLPEKGQLGIAFQKKERSLIRIALCWASLVIPYVLWKIEVGRSGCFAAFQEPVNIPEYLRVIAGSTQGVKRTMWLNYFHGLFTPGIPMSNLGISVTPAACFMAALGCCWFSGKAAVSFREDGDHRLIPMIFSIFAGVLFFLLGLGAVYLYELQDATATNLPSFSRYISTCLLGLTAFAALGIVRISHFRKNLLAAVLAMMFITMAPQSGISDFVSGKYTEDSLSQRKYFQAITDKVLSHTEGEEVDVFVLDQGGPGWAFWYYRTLLFPSRVRNNANGGVGELGWSIGTRTAGGIDISSEELHSILLDHYDIFLIDTVNDAFIEDYSALFADPAAIQNGAIFAVNRESGLLELLE